MNAIWMFLFGIGLAIMAVSNWVRAVSRLRQISDPAEIRLERLSRLASLCLAGMSGLFWLLTLSVLFASNHR